MGRVAVGTRDPREDIGGSIFPAASSAIGPGQGTLYGDAGDGEHQYSLPGIRRAMRDAGRDMVADGGGRDQWSPPLWGMERANSEYRTRFLVALDQPSVARPRFAVFAMRPSATAIHPREFGEPGGVQTRRMVAPGRVTKWGQPSLVWPELGTRNG